MTRQEIEALALPGESYEEARLRITTEKRRQRHQLPRREEDDSGDRYFEEAVRHHQSMSWIIQAGTALNIDGRTMRLYGPDARSDLTILASTIAIDVLLIDDITCLKETWTIHRNGTYADLRRPNGERVIRQ